MSVGKSLLCVMHVQEWVNRYAFMFMIIFSFSTLQGPPGAPGAEGRQGEKGAKVRL